MTVIIIINTQIQSLNKVTGLGIVQVVLIFNMENRSEIK